MQELDCNRLFGSALSEIRLYLITNFQPAKLLIRIVRMSTLCSSVLVLVVLLRQLLLLALDVHHVQSLQNASNGGLSCIQRRTTCLREQIAGKLKFSWSSNPLCEEQRKYRPFIKCRHVALGTSMLDFGSSSV